MQLPAALAEIARLAGDATLEVSEGAHLDEHLRYPFYVSAMTVCPPAAEPEIIRLIAQDPDWSMARSALITRIERHPYRSDPTKLAEWLDHVGPALPADDFLARRVADVQVLAKHLDRDVAAEVDAIREGSDWLQRRLVAESESLEVLDLLAGQGRTKRLRGQAEARGRNLRSARVPKSQPGLPRTLARVSIRGRMAFALVCIERTAAVLDVSDPTFVELLDFLWTYTSVSDLADWEFHTRIRTAGFFGAFDGWSSDDDDPLPDFPAPIRRMLLHAVEEVGCGNLYAGVVDHSRTTLDGTLRVVSIADGLRVPIPSSVPFLRSSFEEAHGWGDVRDRSFFVEPFEDGASSGSDEDVRRP